MLAGVCCLLLKGVVVDKKLSVHLFECQQRLRIGRDQIDRNIGWNELDIIIDADNLSGLQRLDVLLVNVARLIVEETM